MNAIHALIKEVNSLAINAQFETCIRILEEALKQGQNDAEVLRMLGACYYECGDFLNAINYTRQALSLASNHAQTRFQLANLLLTTAVSADAWSDYTSRKSLPNVLRGPTPPLPEWQGQDIRGKTILLIAEQGYGDTLQFLRYARRLVELGVHVVLDIPQALRPLIALHPECGRVLNANQSAQISCYALLGDLPLRFGEHPHHPQISHHYLNRDRISTTHPRQAQVPRKDQLGITWQGSRTNGRDALRSIPLSDFKELTSLTQYRCVALDNKATPDLIQQSGLHDQLHLPEISIANFLDLAQCILDLDLVITVDTAVAHLCGCLGTPVWILLNHVADWRWQQTGQTTDWYPSARLFRQQKGETWSEVLQGVCMSLSPTQK